MRAIVDAASSQGWPARIAAVVSNRADAEGLQWAASRGIPTSTVASREFADRQAFDAALLKEIERFKPDIVVLAGFLRILTPAFVDYYRGRMLNIHPSLLPSFPGLHTHQAALDAGVKVHGATVHFVTAELDHGPIVAQATVPVLSEDDEGSLALRVLEQEHIIYPEAVRCLVDERLVVEGNRVRIVDAAVTNNLHHEEKNEASALDS
ncbi:MAG: phosphoribosylglycinamide formyltransferase [Herminiimonas sp.]|nr:phosphoribosylglycinamide formyltransferase [Herminiimonas sp.]MDB5853764.1 phosphoribosylglycinamide formyltransferase [Herminiimonas sp.]